MDYNERLEYVNKIIDLDNIISQTVMSKITKLIDNHSIKLLKNLTYVDKRMNLKKNTFYKSNDFNIKLIGKGREAIIYEVTIPKTIKFVIKKYFEKENMKEGDHLRTEIDFAEQITEIVTNKVSPHYIVPHPNLIDDNKTILELGDGQFRELIKHNKLNDDQWLSLFFQISYSFFVLFDKYQIVHNDPNLENIMFIKTKENKIKYSIMDREIVHNFVIPTFGNLITLTDYGHTRVINHKTGFIEMSHNLFLGYYSYDLKKFLKHLTKKIVFDISQKYSYDECKKKAEQNNDTKLDSFVEDALSKIDKYNRRAIEKDKNYYAAYYIFKRKYIKEYPNERHSFPTPKVYHFFYDFVMDDIYFMDKLVKYFDFYIQKDDNIVTPEFVYQTRRSKSESDITFNTFLKDIY